MRYNRSFEREIMLTDIMSDDSIATIAMDASCGNCPNCSVLKKSLVDYKFSLLALKKKLKVADEAIKLQEQLEELKIKLVNQEKTTADYELLRAELHQKKICLKGFEQLSEKMENLKQENIEILEDKKKLEDKLRIQNEIIEAQRLQISQLRKEMAAMEIDLLGTKASLKVSLTQDEKIEKLMVENAVTKSTSENLKIQVKGLEDRVLKQEHRISLETNQKILLESNLRDVQTRLMRLERDLCKDHVGIATQTFAPQEGTIDKEKVRGLLQSLWSCLNPDQKEPSNLLFLPDFGQREILPSHQDTFNSFPYGTSPAAQIIQQFHGDYIKMTDTNRQLRPPPHAQQVLEYHTSQFSSGNMQTYSPKRETLENLSPEESELNISSEEILKMFKPLLPCLSPLPEEDVQSGHVGQVCSLQMDEQEHNGPTEQSQNSRIRNFSNKTSSSLTDHSQKPPAHQENNSSILPEEMELGCEQTSNEKDMVCGSDRNDTLQGEDTMLSWKNNVPVEELVPALPVVTTPPPSSATANNTALVTRSPKPSCLMDVSSNVEKNKDGDLKPEIKMDLDFQVQDNFNPPAANSENEKGPTDSEAAANSKKRKSEQMIASPEFDKSAKGTNISKSEEFVQNPLDSCPGPKDVASHKHRETLKPYITDSEMSECFPSSIGDRITSEIKANLGCGENKQLSEGVVSTSLQIDERTEFNLRNIIAAPKAMTERGECDEDVSKSSSKNNMELHDNKVTSSCSPSGSKFPEALTVNSKSLEENTHNICRQSSPTSLLPIKCKTRVTPPVTNISETNVNTEPDVAALFQIDCVNEKDLLIRVFLGDVAQDNTNTCSKKTSDKITSPTKSIKKSPDSCQTMLKKCSDIDKSCTEASPTTAQMPEYIGQVLCEMGPPLPPVLTPISTPQKSVKSINPKHAIGKLSFLSPMDGMASPTTPGQTQMTPERQKLSHSYLKSPAAQNEVPSSPLQFGSATPKHAVPVPGRLPLTARISPSSTCPSQENSMRILDTMYPALSARARTLSILRGNVSLSISSQENGALPTTTDLQVSGFKTISSSSTAFTKTEMRGEKRRATNLPQPENAKVSKKISSPPDVSKQLSSPLSNSGNDLNLSEIPSPEQLKAQVSVCIAPEEPLETILIVDSLEKIKDQCFDLLPVIRSHLYVGNLPKKPVLRDEEKKVLTEIFQSSPDQSDVMILALQNELKAVKNLPSPIYTQALCRVYTAICRQKRYHEKARILAYSILTEDYPDSVKLILFMATTWPTFLSHNSSLCKAIHAVTKQKANKELLCYVSEFLGWEKNPPCEVDLLISTTLSYIRSGSNQTFIKHDSHGVDLGHEAWEQIFTLYLLCSHKKWKWTYENFLGKELWPFLNFWLSKPKDSHTEISDVTIATVIRLIGCLGQIGLKENFVSLVDTVADIMNTFGRQGQKQGLPWEIQLAAVYCIYELSPCNPKRALDALTEWKEKTNRSVPPAVTSYISQLEFVCRRVKN